MTKIYIISGFLGSGKTTFINKLLNTVFKNKKTALIENDFGEKSLDAAIFKSEGFCVTELNSGCICCSIKNDFKKSLVTVIEKYFPEVIIIEPSGVAKLSDIKKACNINDIADKAYISKKITVVDCKNCKSYYDNFGEFFDDQIKNADTIVLSKTLNNKDNIIESENIIKSLNSKVQIIDEEWDNLSSEKLDDIIKENKVKTVYIKELNTLNKQKHNLKNNHCADDKFSTYTLKFTDSINLKKLTDLINGVEQTIPGLIVRIKGIVLSGNKNYNIQYVLGETNISETELQENELCIIGSRMRKEEIEKLFSQNLYE